MSQLRILLVGNGGREHTLAWKLAQSERVESIHVVPGNGGTARVPKTTNHPTVSASDFPALVTHARTHNLNLLIPGPEAPLVAGITDTFTSQLPSCAVFGPSAAAARLEGSKTYAKNFMARHSIPTARYENFTDFESAAAHVEAVDYPVVIKADGLAGGKGVIIPQDKGEAKQALKDILLSREFGEAGDAVVVEELLVGEEVSILSLSDGRSLRSLPAAQDHKRIGDGDTGPNTGGMGTYAPTPLVSAEQLREIERFVLQPTIDGLRAEGMGFVGCLFTGFMMTKDGPRVLEYNVRFGDPETQSCLPLLESDLAELMVACCEGSLGGREMKVSGRSACTVVVAAEGYPGSYKKGTEMVVQEPSEEGVHVFHAGTDEKGGKLVTTGGRVAAVTATGAGLKEAVDRCYANMGLVGFEGMQYRRDIAARALK
ncbi:hypothetical protein MBLNU230_g2747t1 [Neophaeotheca triangularis]